MWTRVKSGRGVDVEPFSGGWTAHQQTAITASSCTNARWGGRASNPRCEGSGALLQAITRPRRRREFARCSVDRITGFECRALLSTHQRRSGATMQKASITCYSVLAIVGMTALAAVGCG